MPSTASLFLLCLAVSTVVGFPLRQALDHFRILDQPNQRSSHTAPTARGGGIGILAAITAGAAWMSVRSLDPLVWITLAVAFGVAVVSLIDDVRGLSAAVRFGTHLMAGVILLASGGFWEGTGLRAVSEALPGVPPRLLLPILLLVIVGYTNAFNFMDGINGIAGMQAGITAMATGIIGGMGGHWTEPAVLLSFAVSAASFGFLPHNFPRARMFMGDVGSAPLGMLLAFLALWVCRDRGFHLAIPLAVLHANFVLDTVITLTRRILRGDNWLQPHREHFYQRLIRAGKSHPFVTGVECLLLVACSIAAILTAREGLAARMFSSGVILLVWLGFFVYAERLFKRSNAKAATSAVLAS
jgi:UDP-N-acetylmuramyl pentapeptide phosphotransferase/UDP-N-acetylglucosamine-1-phosphate transferase